MDSSHADDPQLAFDTLSVSPRGSRARGKRRPAPGPALLPDGKPYAVYEHDAVEWLRTLPAESVDLLVTDPPYESLEKHRAIGTTTRLKHSKASSNDWFRIFPNTRFPDFFREAYRVLARDRHFYLFSDAETMFVVKPLAEAAGFKFWKPLVWDKVLLGMGYHYRCRYEFILFFEKGKRRILDLSIADVISHPRVRGGYPTEKPAALSEVLIRQSTSPGEIVADPFMGSGSAGVAALSLGRRFVGTDISPNALELSIERLRSALP
jgi:site-specific DNA-methyltransferase (adenine-specific)